MSRTGRKCFLCGAGLPHGDCVNISFGIEFRSILVDEDGHLLHLGSDESNAVLTPPRITHKSVNMCVRCASNIGALAGVDVKGIRDGRHMHVEFCRV